jgi:hypothetical protein
MRYVEATARGALLCAVLASLVGCAAVGEPFRTVQPSAAASANAAPAAADAASKEAPVAPATRRAFDDATRA